MPRKADEGLTLRDELAWRAFVHVFLVTNRRVESFAEHAVLAYKATDVFLAERAQQQEDKP